MNPKILKTIKQSPQTPGVYLFFAKNNPLYIGKAANLKARLQNYLKPTDHKTEIIHQEAIRLQLIQLASPISALIEEARLIKNLKPKLNIYWSDDKQYFYIALTKEKLPKLFLTHQKLKIVNCKLKIDYVGPFTDGRALKLILRLLRKHYPYCSCLKPHLRHCLNAQIGLCPGHCCQKNYQPAPKELKSYRLNLKIIKTILSGENKSLLKKIITPSSEWAMTNILAHSEFINKQKEGGFEEALGGALAGSDRFLFKPIGNAPRGSGLRPPESENHDSEKLPSFCCNKIECYDISNFAGKEAVGAMTVLSKSDFNNWVADKNQFRKFKIKNSATRDDPRMIAEILTRRLNHPEWPYPDLIIIDGGLTQYRAAHKALKTKNSKIKIILISFAKPRRQIHGLENLSTQDRELIEKLKKERVIEQAIRQTHRFVINYHRNIRDKMRTT